MLIIDIISIDKKKKKIILEDGSFFCLYNKEIQRLELEIGKELSLQNQNEIFEEILVKRAKERVLYLLKDSDKTEYQLREKLKAGFYPKEIIDKAVAYAKLYHYIDDSAYTRRYAEQMKKNLSYRQMVQKLTQKGISKGILEEVLENTQENELEALDRLLRKKNLDFSAISYEEKQKIYLYFMRKGFSYENILKKINEFESQEHLT